MPTDNQKKNIEALLTRPKKRRARDHYTEAYSEGAIRGDGGVDYLSVWELREISEKIKRGGYDKCS